MGTIRQIGNEYLIEFYARGLLYQRKAGKDRQAAQRLLEEIESKIRSGEMDAIVRDIEIDVFFHTFCDKARREFTQQTFFRYQAVITDFHDFFRGKVPGNFLLSRVTPRVIELYREALVSQPFGDRHRLLRPQVVNFTLYLLKDIFDFAITLGYLNDNPVFHARPVLVLNQYRPRTLTPEEHEEIMSESPEDGRAIAIALWETGMRLGELERLKWTDIDFHNNSITIIAPQAMKTRENRQRSVPMGEGLSTLFRRLKEQRKSGQDFVFGDGQVSGTGKSSLTRKIERVAGKTKLNAVSFALITRNTFAKNVLDKGVSLIRLAALFGLSDIAQVMYYSVYVRKNP